MVQAFELRYSSKDAPCIVGGAIILKGRDEAWNLFFDLADALIVANA